MADTRETPEHLLAGHLRLALAALLVLVVVGVPSVTHARGAAAVAESAARAAPFAAVSRLAGGDRFETAIAISKHGYPSGSDVVYLATGMDYPDALAAAPAAAASGAPLLLTRSESIPAAVIAEIDRLEPETIVAIGGEAAISEVALKSLVPFANKVDRIAGRDRFETSRKVAEYAFDGVSGAYVATGLNYPDALAASAAAGAATVPIVLVDGRLSSVDAETAALFGRLGSKSATIAGGPAVVPVQIEESLRSLGLTVQRRAGADRFETAVAVNSSAFPTATRAYLANATSFTDALAGAALAGKEKAPLYLVRNNCLPLVTIADMNARLHVSSAVLLGGTDVLTESAATLMDCPTWEAQQKQKQKQMSEMELTAKLNALMPNLPGSYSVAVREVGGTQRAVSIRGGDMKEPASSIKLFAAYVVLKYIDEGRLSFESRTSSGTSVRECMRAMIHISDNPCHVELIALVGQQNINDILAREGYSGTHYVGWANGTQYSTKTSTASDFVTLLSRLQAGTLLSRASSDHLHSLMELQIWRTRVASGIPPGVRQASKIGHLWVSSGMVDTDAAIVYAPSGTYVISVLGSQGANASAIARISRTVYEHFNGPFGAAASYPKQQMYTWAPATLYTNAGTGPIRTIPAGTLVEAIDSVRVWYRVTVDGRTGYINSNYLANR